MIATAPGRQPEGQAGRLTIPGSAIGARYLGRALSSHFQPIFSIAHRRAVGFEGLVRAQRGDGRPEPPAELLSLPQTGREMLELDRICRSLHMQNFVRQHSDDAWLFLNLNSQCLVRERPDIGFTRKLLDHCGLPARRLVIEIIENRVDDPARLQQFIGHFRQLGCLIAIDDFGAGHSNFDRVWELEPDIVKIDRGLVRRAAGSRRVERILTGLVALIHEAGSLVVLEGVETEEEALVAIAANADMVQGYFLARPQPLVSPHREVTGRIDRLLRGRQWQRPRHHGGPGEDLQLFEGQFRQAVEDYSRYRRFEQSGARLFADPRVVRCYLLDEAGYQMTRNLYAPHYRQRLNPRFTPLLCGGNANWSHKHYHYRALQEAGKTQISQPYLSVADSRMCITLSQTVNTGDRLQVFCCDLDWQEPQAAGFVAC
ncbi:EAL domain-containing protein [Marinobacterium aestuariivivens]|uniref:EAL domain-containing protein n=1 Tax=Marinobacterium aestuariivivens TaxID=1698799 RepID=A0ABW2A5Z0_9GAMM